MIIDNADILLISETETDSSFPTIQFHIDGNKKFIDVMGMKAVVTYYFI